MKAKTVRHYEICKKKSFNFFKTLSTLVNYEGCAQLVLYSISDLTETFETLPDSLRLLKVLSKLVQYSSRLTTLKAFPVTFVTAPDLN